MKYCSQCGSEVTILVPEGDNRNRHVCQQCDFIHYQNPRIICGCLPTWEDKVLLCKRAIEPRLGFWTLPAGFMENGETVQEGAARETFEEAEADVELGPLYTVFNLPSINQVYMFFMGQIKDGKFGVGIESLESDLYDEVDIPWDNLAFPTITKTLKHFFEDRKTQEFPVRVIDLHYNRRPVSDT